MNGSCIFSHIPVGHFVHTLMVTQLCKSMALSQDLLVQVNFRLPPHSWVKYASPCCWRMRTASRHLLLKEF